MYDAKIMRKFQSVSLTVVEDKSNIKLFGNEDGRDETEERPTLLDLIKLVSYKQINGFRLNVSDITVVNLSHITSVNLNDIQTLEIPNLKEFVAQNSSLSLVPPFVYNSLSTLEYLDLSQNFITHCECSFKSIKTIKVIKMNNNKLKNLPKWFLTYECSSLEELDFSYNCVKLCHHSNENYNFQIMNITKLKLKNCGISDKRILCFFKEFRTLTYLDISNDINYTNENKFQNVGDIFLDTEWPKLETLFLKNLSLHSFPKCCVNLLALKELDLSYNTLWNLPEDIQKMSNLEILNIEHAEIYSLPENLNELYSLVILKASFNFIEEIKNIPRSLQYLDAYNNKIDTVKCDVSCVNCDFGLNFIDFNSNRKYVEGRQNLWIFFNINNRVTEVKYREDTLENTVIEDDHCCDDTNSIGSRESGCFQCLNFKCDCICDGDNNKHCQNKSVNDTDSDQWEDQSPSHQVNTFIHPEIISYQLSEDQLFEDAD